MFIFLLSIWILAIILLSYAIVHCSLISMRVRGAGSVDFKILLALDSTSRYHHQVQERFLDNIQAHPDEGAWEVKGSVAPRHFMSLKLYDFGISTGTSNSLLIAVCWSLEYTT